MEKRIIAMAVAVVVVIAILGYVVVDQGVLQPKGGGTTIAITANTTSTTTNTTTSIQPIPTSTIQSFQGCLSSTPTVPIFNGNFSTGNFIGWNVTGDGFGSAPLNITYQNQNNTANSSDIWKGYNGTFFASTYQGGITISPGNLTSRPFEVTEPYLNFRIDSPQENEIYVEVLKNGVPAVRDFYDTLGQSGNNYRTFMNASIPLATLFCSNVTIKVVADVVSTPSTHYDFMAIGDFYTSRNPPIDESEPLNQTFLNAS